MTMQSAAPCIVVVFRNDDPSACSSAAHERRIAGIFERYGMPQTLGVIPMNTPDDPHDPRGTRAVALGANPEMVAFLRDYAARSGSEIALHGYTHQTNTRSIPSRREYFEFRRLGLVEQERRISHGIAILEQTLGVRPTTFIPPWQRLDQDTLEACRRTGLRLVSAGPFTPPQNDLAVLGTDCDLETLPQLLRTVRPVQVPVLLRVLYHSRTTRTDREIAQLEEALQAVARTPGCAAMTLSEAAARFPNRAKLANEAARNIVPEDQIPQSVRARASIYRRAAHRLLGQWRLERLYRMARDAYGRGDYETACALTPAIDRLTGIVLVIGRASLTAAAFSCGLAVATAASHVHAEARTWLLLTPIALTATVFGSLWFGATAPDTRAELRTAGSLVTAALVFGVIGGLRLFALQIGPR